MTVKARKKILKFNYAKNLIHLKTYPNFDEEFLENFKKIISIAGACITAN